MSGNYDDGAIEQVKWKCVNKFTHLDTPHWCRRSVAHTVLAWLQTTKTHTIICKTKTKAVALVPHFTVTVNG